MDKGTSASSEWSARYDQATRYLDEIRGRLAEDAREMTPTSVDWADVGDMGRVVSILRQLVATLRECDPDDVE